MRTVIFVALAVALTGCLGGGDGEIAPTATAPDAGGSDPELDNDPVENASVEEAAPPAPVERNVTLDGETGTFLCVTTPEGFHCQGEFSSTASTELPYEGTPMSLVGEVTWNASSPLGRELQVAIFVMENGEPVYNETAPRTSGTSPLQILFDLREFAGQQIAVDVSSVHQQDAGPVGVAGSMAQAFHLEGVLTFQPDA